MTTYRIQSRDEETCCKYCGCLLEVGDRVTENAAADPFCSKTCAVVHDSRFKPPSTKYTSVNVEPPPRFTGDKR